MEKYLYNYGMALIDQIKATKVPDDAIAIWYLGQESMLLKKGSTTVLVDPYLTDYVDRLEGSEKGFWVRKYPSPVKPELMDFVDYVLCTHDHGDHMDPDTLRGIASAGSKTRFVVPQPSLALLLSLGINGDRAFGAQAGSSIRLGELQIVPVAAAHDEFHRDSEGNYMELSYIIKWGGITLLHGGDMSVYPGLPELLKSFDIDVAMLPINGGDWLRDGQGIVGNTGFREAADLGAAAGADIIIPMHFDLYAVNEENPAFFVDYIYRRYPGQKYHIFQPGERLVCFRES